MKTMRRNGWTLALLSLASACARHERPALSTVRLVDLYKPEAVIQ